MNIFTGTVEDSCKSYVTCPPSEVLRVSYELPPVEVVREDGTVTISDRGWFMITLPVYNGVKVGSRIEIQTY